MSEQPPNTSNPSPPTQAAPTTSSPEPKLTETSNPFVDVSDEVAEAPRPESTTSSSPPAVNAATRPPPQQASPAIEQTLTDPAIIELKAMFPDYDEIILISVLQSTNGNQAAAIDILLGMSDPNYKAEGPPPQAPALTQTELDEQFARRLAFEEQQQQQQAIQWAGGGRHPQRRQSRYGQSEQAPGSPPAPGAQGGEKDAMTEIQEQFTKVAEAGKKTFGNLFTKVKAKIQEFERGGVGQGSSSDAPSTQWVGGYDPQAHPQTQYAPYHHHGAAHPQQQASYYDPNTPITLSSSQTTTPPQSVPAPAVQGYDASPNVGSPPSARAASTTPAPPTTSTGIPPPNPSSAPIDAGKLGLLPKKPVSLIRDPPSGQTAQRRDSEDDLEYAENPFEDQRK